MRRTKANRALTFVMAAALLIGSIHGVGAKEQSKAYDAPELTLTQGVTDYDLTAGITYDSEKYTLSVTDTGNFDVNVAGDYEISYALTEKESSVNVTESVENTDSVESIENIESTETVSGTETIETTDAMATVEDTDQTPEGDATNTVDTQEKQVITFTRTVHVVAASEDEVPMYEARELVLVQGEEGYDLTDEILYDDVKYTLTVGDLGGFDINKIGSYEVTYSLTPVATQETQGNGQDDTQDNQVITFQRTVTVKAAVEETGEFEVPELYLEQGQEDYDLAAGLVYDENKYKLNIKDDGNFDIMLSGEYKVTFVLNPLEENPDSENNTGDADTSDPDQTEDTFVIPDGITTFTRKVIVSPSLVRSAGLLDDLTTWPDESLLTEDVIEINFKVGVPIKPGKTINVRSGQTITVSNGLLTGGTNTLFNVQDGGHLTLNNVTITGNTVDDQGAVCVQNGALLDLGYNDKMPVVSPQIINNNSNGKARNLVVADGSKVRLNVNTVQKIGISYLGDITKTEPKALIHGGRYAITDSDVNNFTSDETTCETILLYDQIILRYAQPKFLFFDQVQYFAQVGYPNIATYQPIRFEQAGAKVDKICGTPASSYKITDISDIMQYDLIMLCTPYPNYYGSTHDFDEAEYEILAEYINNGGRIIIQAEDAERANPFWKTTNPVATNIARKLGAGFQIVSEINGSAVGIPSTSDMQVMSNDLTSGIAPWNVFFSSPILLDAGILSTTLFKARATNGQYYSFCEDMQAGTRADGSKWGNIMILADADIWGSTTAPNTIQFAKNLIENSYSHRASAAADVNPNNNSLDYQAKLLGSDSADKESYMTPAAALEKVGQDETVVLLKNSGLTSVDNMLLYNSSSIKEMNGNTVHADSNGTNIDVSDTGAITLRSGAVTVSNTGANTRKLTVDGYVLTSTADYTVKAVDTSNDTTLGDSQVSVTLKAIGDTFTAVKNGATYTYTATKDNQTFYLGEYSAVLNWDERSGVAALASIGSPKFPAELVKPQTQPANPYHQLKRYTVTIKPREDYSIDVDKVWVSMGVDVQGKPQMLDASEFNKSKDMNTGIITVIINKPVDGDLIYYVGKVNGGSSSGSTVTHDRTTIQVTSAAGSAVTTPEFTATYFDEQKSKDITVSSQNGKVEVFKNVEVTLKFPAMNTSDPNPTEGALGITEDETFDILTKLVETGNATDLKAGFEWTDKSYTYKFTSTSTSYNLEASYEKSHVVHIHVSGGSMDASTIPAGLEANKQSLSNIRIIVPDQTTLDNLKFSPYGSLQNPSFTVKWLSHDNTTDLGAVNFSENAGSWKGSTLAVTQPSYLNVSFVAGQMLTIRIKGGTLDTAYGTPVRNWITKAAASSGFDHEYQLVVPENDQTVHFKINVEGSRLLKSILANTKDVTSMVEAVKDQNNRIIAYTNGDAGSTIGEATTIDVTLVPSCTVTFWNKEISPEKKIGTEMVMEGGKLDKAAYEKMAAGAVLPGYQFMAWKDTAGKVYTDQTVISAATELHAVFREKINISQNGNIIAANDFKIHLNSIKKGAFNTSEAVKRAKAEAYDANGKDVTNLISVEGLNAVQKEGTFPLTFKYDDASITVNVTVTNAIPVVTGKTAYTLTFEGVPNGASEYKVYSMSGAVVAGAKIEETANGIYRITGLAKGTEYKIEGDVLGSTTGKTALVDAEDIAKQFEDKQGDTKANGKKGKDEEAENPNVKVVVDDEGNYKVIVKKNIDHSVEIPDTWGDVKVDLGGNSINGNDADAANSAKPGLIFKKDSGNDHPGTNLVISNGTIQGGNGSAAHPDGAAGIGTATPDRPADAKITVGADAKVQGGNGADAGDSTGADAANGGNGGAGIEGEITPTIDGGTVTGGNGGKGGSSDTGAPGNGGNGGTGISAGDKTITINPGGTVKGGDAGNGGNATGDNTNPGGNGGNGGTGTETTQPGKTDNNGGTTSGGNGGDGGKSDNGNGGNGGNGGSGSTGESNNNGGTNSGGNGGNGGDSDKGNGGTGGNGGSSGETGGNGGNNTGGNGGTGGDSNNGHGGSGGNGGESNSGTGGNGGNGGDSNNGTGGNGGTGGESNSGNGGNGGDGGNGKNPGNGGNGGGSNSGNNGSSGSDGSKPDNNGGNNGGNNNGGNNNGGDSNGNGGSNGGGNGNNNGGSGSGGNGNGGNGSGNNSGNGSNNGSSSNGNANGTNTGVTDGKTNATDIAAADGNNASGGNKNNKHNRNNKSDQADGEDVTEGTETGADTGSDDTTDVADSTETGADADGSGNTDDSIPADSSDADGHISFADCGFHWYPVILILVIAGYTVLRIRKIREELDGE